MPTLIDGEHQRNMLGLFGTVVALRIMVPRSQLRLGYELASEIIEDLPEPHFDADEGEGARQEPMPHRRALPEDLVAYPNDDEEEEDEDDMAELRERRSLFGPRVGFGLGLIFAGVQLVAGDTTRGMIVVAIMLGLAYLRVLALTRGEPK